MHKLAKGLKKKKKPKKGKKGAEEDEFDPEELERYRRERAEAQEKAAAEAASAGEVDNTGEAAASGGAGGGSDEWQKFQALTAGVDSILKKTQGDLDRIKSTSFFQRKAPIEDQKHKKQKEAEAEEEEARSKAKRWVGFDKDGNPIESNAEEAVEQVAEEGRRKGVSEEGFVDVPDDEDDQDDSAEEDIFDTTYVDVLQNIDVQLAYIPDSPTEEEAGDDPFDTTSADKVLKTVDKKGNKLVSLGNAVEVLSGRIDHVSTCKISRPRKARTQDLLLDDFDDGEALTEATAAEPFEVQKTLLDDDTDFPDVPVDLANLPSVLPRPVTPAANGQVDAKPEEVQLNISEFEVLKEKTLLEEIPDLDDAEFDLVAPVDVPVGLEDAEDPFGTKETGEEGFEAQIIEASFAAATFVNEEDPFDTTFAENILPGKAELKFIERELEELPATEVSISLTDPSGLKRDYETGFLSSDPSSDSNVEKVRTEKQDLLGGSCSDLDQLSDQPIAPAEEEITYVDPFDTSGIQELPPGQTELKFLERELLGEDRKVTATADLDDDDFDPRKEEKPTKAAPPPRPQAPVHQGSASVTAAKASFQVIFDEDQAPDENTPATGRKPSRPEALGLGPAKTVAFELPTPSKRPDLLQTSDEEKSISSKPLTPYYSQKSLEETLPEKNDAEVDVDPFDTSFVAKAAPGKTELKLIESALLTKQEPRLKHSISDHDFDPRSGTPEPERGRRQSDFGAVSLRPKTLKGIEPEASLIEEYEATPKPSVFEVNEAAHRGVHLNRRQESLLDAEVEVDAKPLTPRIEARVSEEDTEISYVDPFDTSIATNLLPGKAELKLLENELSQLPEEVRQVRTNPIDLDRVSVRPVSVDDEDDFDPRAGEVQQTKDFLCLDGQDSGDKVLTPLHNQEFVTDDNADPFDTSFASIGPGPVTSNQSSSKMASKGGNPFLMDDYPTEPDPSQQASNPFLQGFGDQSATDSSGPTGGGENPFLNFAADQATYEPPTDSTNPFAFFGVEPAQNADFSVPEPTSTASDVYDAPQPNFFGIVEEPAPVEMFEKPAVAVPVAKNGKPTPARPPPPPRPHPPLPPKNTKDLILSVTGAMDATSNHLLDRLQATRTPSPTLMHSPSPTPEHSFADLLDVDGNVPDLMSDDGRQPLTSRHQDIMDLFDAPNTEASAATMFSEAHVGLDTSTQLVSSTDTTFATGIIDTTAKMPENPFGVPAEPQLSTDEEDTGFGTSVPVGEILIPAAEEKRASMDSGVTPFSVADTTTGVSTTVPVSSSFDFHQDVADVPITESFVPSPEETNFFSVAEPVASATPEPTAAAPFSTSAPIGIFGAESLFSTAGSTDNAPAAIPSQEPVRNVFASDLLSDFTTLADEGDLAAASPEPGAEFPSPEHYRNDNLDNFAAATEAIQSTGDAFDAFATKFDKAAEPEAAADPFFDAFGAGQVAMDTSSDVWGDSSVAGSETATAGFGEHEGFDSFLSMTAPPQEQKTRRTDSADSDDAPDFSVFIKPKEGDQGAIIEGGPVPVLAPPPKSPQNAAYNDSSPRFNPFDKSAGFAQEAGLPTESAQTGEITRTDSQETPPTPLFDDDVSQPLEDFPRVTYTGDGWEMQLRQPNKKKITGQRFWKKIFVRLVYQGENPVLQLFNDMDDKDPFQELPLLACYSVSEISAQQFDQYGKIFTLKLQYIFYKERPGVRPGQVTKAERLTNKLSQFAAYAIQGDYQGVKEFGSDLKKLGLPVEHAPQISQLFKLGSQLYEDMKQFSSAIEEALFRLSAHRDRALTYKMEEVQISVVDELYVEQSAEGFVEKQIARVRLFFLGFLTGMPDVELGINDMWRQGKEVVGRHDIIPVVTEEWIRLENVEFHSCVQQDEYERSRIIKFKPPDACYIELMRFRVRPPKNRELPLQLKAVMCVTGNKVELRADILVPGFASRKLGQVPCEDVVIRFPIPECWIYLFRVEKHFRYGSVKSAHRRTGKIKGIERFLGAVDTLEPQLMEVTSGQAKYEHQHRAIVWRMPRLPKEGQGAYTTHGLVCRMALTSYDQIPENLAEYCYVEFTMPATQVSHTTARSVSLQNSDSDNPPEKYVRNLSRHEYRVGIEHTQGEGPGAYAAATKKIPEATPEVQEEVAEPAPAESDSDSSE